MDMLNCWKRSSARFDIPVRIVSELWSLDHETRLRVANYITTNYAEVVQYARAQEAFNRAMDGSNA